MLADRKDKESIEKAKDKKEEEAWDSRETRVRHVEVVAPAENYTSEKGV